MKQSSKERLASLMMEELLERLSTRESIRKMLGDMTSLPIDDVLEHLLSEFERAVEVYRSEHLPQAKAVVDKPAREDVSTEQVVATPSITKPEAPPVQVPPSSPPPTSTQETTKPRKSEPASPEPAKLRLFKPEPEVIIPPPTSTRPEPPAINKDEPARTIPTGPSARAPVENKQPPLPKDTMFKLDPIKLEFPEVKLTIPEKPRTLEKRQETPAAKPASSPEPKKATEEEELRKLEELARKIEAEYAAKAKEQRNRPPDKVDETVGRGLLFEDIAIPSEDSLIDDDDEISSGEVGVGSKHTTRAPYEFTDDEYVYLHAAGRIPAGETPSQEPFMLEEKGINEHEFAFAMDYNEMRFYLSKINPNEMSVSKAMVLLLNKHESLQMQGVHQSILNDLRGHGILLPFEFGSVTRGKDALHVLIDKNLDDLEGALDEIEKTTWWTVTANVLDSFIAQIVGTDVQSFGRDHARERASYTSSVSGKKYDIKVLERILQREKKLAESIHEGLSAVAERSDVDSMVGLGSGSSEDWKSILKASYDVPLDNIAKFNRTITDLQYHHLQYDLMLVLSGDREYFTLRKK